MLTHDAILVNSVTVFVFILFLERTLLLEMVGCVAMGCNNSSAKGFRMFRFPSNPERQAAWVEKCGRFDWSPTASSRLCEAHFDGNQWEFNRQDGWKKLKQTAIPLLFDDPYPTPTNKARTKGKAMRVTGSPLFNIDVKTEPNDTRFILVVEDESSDESAHVNKKFEQAYRTEWESLPDFKGWLTSVPDSPHAAYCRICSKHLSSHRKNLLKHKVTKKHLANEEKLFGKGGFEAIMDKSSDDSSYFFEEYLEDESEDEKCAMTRLSTHVLDTSRGLPASIVGVSLFVHSNEDWLLLHEGKTNNDGRYDKFSDSLGDLKPGRYKLHFAVEEYFSQFQQKTIFPFVEVVFEVRENTGKLHIPLLLSPFGYSTYRGS